MKKVKIFKLDTRSYTYKNCMSVNHVAEECINEFLEGKELIDIKVAIDNSEKHIYYTVIYEEKEKEVAPTEEERLSGVKIYYKNGQCRSYITEDIVMVDDIKDALFIGTSAYDLNCIKMVTVNGVTIYADNGNFIKSIG